LLQARTKAYLELHFAIFLFGFTAILGDLIHLPALTLVWWRMLLTVISLLFIVRWRTLLTMPRKVIMKLLLIGALVAIHWLCFFGSIKLANASVALVCFATTAFFTSIIEPIILKRKIIGIELVLGMIILPGMYLVIGATKFDSNSGIIVGLLAAFLAALFTSLNKSIIHQSSSVNMTLIELAVGWLFISILLSGNLLMGESIDFLPQKSDWKYLLILSILCTTLAYVLAFKSLRFISAFVANMSVNLEPVYGIIMAILILNEHKELSFNFYLGVIIILFAISLYPILRKLKIGR